MGTSFIHIMPPLSDSKPTQLLRASCNHSVLKRKVSRCPSPNPLPSKVNVNPKVSTFYFSNCSLNSDRTFSPYPVFLTYSFVTLMHAYVLKAGNEDGGWILSEKVND